jgi:hypothetical protein
MLLDDIKMKLVELSPNVPPTKVLQFDKVSVAI